MTERICRASFWTAVALVAGLILAVDHWSFSEVWQTVSGQTAAAWVQALGSIAAIGGAFILGHVQHLNATKLEISNHLTVRRRRVGALLALYKPTQQFIDEGWTDLLQLSSDGAVNAEGMRSQGFNMSRIVARLAVERLGPLTKYLVAIDPVEYGEAAALIVHLAVKIETLHQRAETLVKETEQELHPNKDVQNAAYLFAAAIQAAAEALAAVCNEVDIAMPAWFDVQARRNSEQVFALAL